VVDHPHIVVPGAVWLFSMIGFMSTHLPPLLARASDQQISGARFSIAAIAVGAYNAEESRRSLTVAIKTQRLKMQMRTGSLPTNG
jgi:hypothetical protein